MNIKKALRKWFSGPWIARFRPAGPRRNPFSPREIQTDFLWRLDPPRKR
jgi:hypothetical protein